MFQTQAEIEGAKALLRRYRRSLELLEAVLSAIRTTGHLSLRDVTHNLALLGAVAILEARGEIEVIGQPDAAGCVPYRIVPQAERAAAKELVAVRNIADRLGLSVQALDQLVGDLHGENARTSQTSTDTV